MVVCDEVAWFVWFIMSLNFYILRISSYSFMSFVLNVNILNIRTLWCVLYVDFFSDIYCHF